MRTGIVASLLTSILTHEASAACSSALLIDNFSTWSSNTNSLDYWVSDDGSMTAISASGNVLSFQPAASSYFYETIPCQATTTNGYNSIQFAIKGPAGGSISLEIQSRTSCSATSYTSKYYTITDLISSTQTVTIPLSPFTGANLNAITAFVWGGFSSTTVTWQMNQI